MSGFSNQKQYESHLASLGGLPEGFSMGVTSLTFLPAERPSAEPYRMNLAFLAADEPTGIFAGVFTRNAVCGAPVHIGRERLGYERMQGVLINNRISNVAAPGGVETALRLTAEAEKTLGIGSGMLFPSSTGIIGWRLPEEEMIQAMPSLAADRNRQRLPALARAIMTTDSFPKIRVRRLAGGGRIVALAKGAGMIEPNMGTMLGFIVTDCRVSREDLRSLLGSSVEESFNGISVDGDQSTSDMILAFSSGRFEVDSHEFAEAFRDICRQLSLDIVRNGEGTAHVMHIELSGSGDRAFLRRLGKAVGNSPLVKTAVYGNDPNVGRILSALGDQAGNEGRGLDLGALQIFIGDQRVFHSGCFDINREKEELLSAYLKEQSQNPRVTGYPQHERCVHIRISLEAGAGAAEEPVHVYASDLGHEYVHENADYRS